MKVLVFGKTGQVASELSTLAASRSDEVVFLGRDEADFEQPAALTDIVERERPDVVVNAVAYTAVDKAESEPDLARRVNAEAPGAIAGACAAGGIPFIHISTDFVFDGEQTRPYREDDPVRPLGVYGATKLEGEEAVMAAGGKPVILRTSWVFSSHGGNFVKTMLRLAETRDTLTIVADQHGQPTPARDIAAAIYTIADTIVSNDDAPSGIYHFSGRGVCSWADFAREIFAQSGRATAVVDIPTREYPTPAARPAYSVLDCRKIESDFGITMKDWRDGLAAVLSALDQRGG